MIPQKYLDKYKAIYRKQYGKNISDQEALEQATKLITLVDAVYRPIPKQDHGDTKDNNSWVSKGGQKGLR